MEKIKGYSLIGQDAGKLKQMIRKLKEVLMGRDFKPMPSYWALVPVSPVRKMYMNEK